MADNRVKITLRCNECKQRNYNTVKNKKNTSEKLERSKYCPFCRKHTKHVETKELSERMSAKMAEDKKKNAPVKNTAAVKKEEKKLGFFQRIGKWFREMRSELKKVIWPTPKQLATNTCVALVVMAVAAVVLWGFDEVAGLIVNVIFELAG